MHRRAPHAYASATSATPGCLVVGPPDGIYVIEMDGRVLMQEARALNAT